MHDDNILKFNSYTTAMNARMILNGKGIHSQVRKYAASSEGCMYALIVPDISIAAKILTDAGIGYINSAGKDGVT